MSDYSNKNKFIFEFVPNIDTNSVFNNVDFKFLQSQIVDVIVPSVTIGNAFQSTTILNIPQIGSGSKEYADLPITFILDDNWKTFLEIYKYFHYTYSTNEINKGIKSAEINASIILLNNYMDAKSTIIFEKIFPYMIPEIDLSSRADSADEIEFQVVFKIMRYYVEGIDNQDTSLENF